MVISAVITKIINRYLSPFVDELTAEQLNIFAWSGTASLSNVNLKANAFDALKLPFRIVQGRIGNIEASVPWRNIYSEPIILKLTDVYALARLNSEILYNEEDEKNFEWALKKSLLEKMEMMKQKIKEQGKEENDGFFMKLLVTAIKNIQITVDNVHICYENSSTSTKNACLQIGLSFSTLLFETELYRVSNNDNIIHKQVKLEGFAVYMNVDSDKKKIKQLTPLNDSQIYEILKNQISSRGQSLTGLEYILCPSNFSAAADIHRKPEVDGYKRPIINLTMHLDSFHLQLTKTQIQTLSSLMEVIVRENTAAPYRKWKPASSIKENPLAWWKFLQTAKHESGIKRRKGEFSWISIETICRKRQEYTELYKRRLLGENVEVASLESLEKELKLTSIAYARSRAEIATKKILESREVTEKASEGWFSGWWPTSVKESKTRRSLRNIQEKFTDTERKALYDAIDYKENAMLELYPHDFIAYVLEFNIKVFQISVKKDLTETLQIVFTNNLFKLKYRPSAANFTVNCQLGSLLLTGKNQVNLLWGQERCKQLFLDLTLEKNPLDKQSDFDVHLSMKSCYLLYDFGTINELFQMVASDSEDTALEMIQSFAQYRLSDLKQKTLSGIELALEEQKQIKLSIQVDPSFVIVPKKADISKADLVVLLSLGKFALSTKLVPKSNVSKVRAMEKSNTDRPQMLEQIRKLIYEEFTCSISNVQLVLSDVTHWKDDLAMLDTERHMICPFQMLLHVGRSIVPMNAQFAKTTLSGEITQIQVKASDTQISQLLNLFLKLPYVPTSSQRNGANDLKQTNDEDEAADALDFATNAAKNLEKASKLSLPSKLPLTEKGANRGDVADAIPQQTLRFDFHLKSLSMSLFTEHRSPNCALGLFQVVKLAVNGEVLADQKAIIKFAVDDLQLDDSRATRKETGICRILAKSQTPQSESRCILTLCITTNSPDSEFACMQMSGFTYTFSLDYMYSLINFAYNAFLTSPDDLRRPSTRSLLRRSKSRLTAPSQAPFVQVNNEETARKVLSIQMDMFEIIMLESLYVPNAVACVLKSFAIVKLQFVPQMILFTGTFDLNMGVANYMKYLKTGKLEDYIMAPTGMEFKGTKIGPKKTFEITFRHINISIAPQMVSVILGIFYSLGSAENQNNPTSLPNDSTEGLLTEKSIVGSTCWYFHREMNTHLAAVENETARLSENKVIKILIPTITIHFKTSGLKSPSLLRISGLLNATIIDFQKIPFDCSFTADYFNEALLAWEPLIEPVNKTPFAMRGVQYLLETSSKLEVEATDNLEILLTKSTISVLNFICDAFSSALTKQEGSLSKIEENGVRIRNSLGIPVLLDMSRSNITEQGASTSRKLSSGTQKEIQSGQEYHFIAENMANVELFITLVFSESVVQTRKITCSNSSVRCYFTGIKTYPINENWKWILQVHDNGHTKEIEFRSNTQIVNDFENSFDIFSHDGKSERSQLVGKVGPQSCIYLSLQLIYSQLLLYIRPSKEFNIPTVPVDWQSLEQLNAAKDPLQGVTRALTLHCSRKNDKTKHFFVKVLGEKMNVLYEDTERLDNDESYIYSIRLVSFVRLKNLLPLSVEFRYNPVEFEVSKLDSGEEAILPYAIFGTSIINITIVNYLEHNWIGEILLPETGFKNVTQYYAFKKADPEKANKWESTICLAINYHLENDSISLSLFAPFWMINQTEENVTYRLDSKQHYRHPARLKSMPYLLAFDPATVGKNRLSLAISQSKYSEYFPLDVVSYSGGFLLPPANSAKGTFYVNVHIEMAGISLSKIVTISPFYSMYNISKKKVEYSEDGDIWSEIEGQSSKAFIPARDKSGEKKLCFRIAGAAECSKYISFWTSSQTLLPIGKDYLFVEVAITDTEAKITISDYFFGAAPLLLVNALTRSLYYGQKSPTDGNSWNTAKCLPPQHTVFFCWPEPDADREFIFWVNQIMEIVNLEVFDKVVTVGKNIHYVDFFDGKQRVLLFTSDVIQANNLLRKDELIHPSYTLVLTFKGVGINLVNPEKKKDLLYLSISGTSIWEGQSEDGKTYRGLTVRESAIIDHLYREYEESAQSGREPEKTLSSLRRHGNYEVDFKRMRLLQPKKMQLQRQVNRSLWFKYSQSAHVSQYHLKIAHIQVDNQLQERVYEVALSPESVVTRQVQLKSFIEACAIIQTLGSVTRCKYFQVLVQEFRLQADYGWFCQICDAFNYETSRVVSNRTLIAKDLETINKNSTLAEMQKFSMRKIYFDYLHLGPLKVHASISLGQLPKGEHSRSVSVIIRIIGLAIGSVNDSLLKLDFFQLKGVSLGDSEVKALISEHYKRQITAQMHKLILGLDIFGNPMKVALGIKKGIDDFFYEPAVGIIHGPEEFAEGMATGVISLASNIIGSTAGALGRISSRIGSGVAVFSADPKFRKQRRKRKNKKVGFGQRGKNLVRGFVDGIAGVVTKPIEGARKQGVEGLVKGVGRGLVGVVIQPTTSIIDFASGSLQALNEAIDPKLTAVPVRPPRPFPLRELTPYLLSVAIGSQLLLTLSEGKYDNETYDYHLQLSSKCIVLLTDCRLFCLKKSAFTGNWESEWAEKWTNCRKITRENLKLHILVKEASKVFIFFTRSNEHVIVGENEENISALYENISRHIKSEQK